MDSLTQLRTHLEDCYTEIVYIRLEPVEEELQENYFRPVEEELQETIIKSLVQKLKKEEDFTCTTAIPKCVFQRIYLPEKLMKKRRTLLESVKQYFKEWIERNTQLKMNSIIHIFQKLKTYEKISIEFSFPKYFGPFISPPIRPGYFENIDEKRINPRILQRFICGYCGIYVDTPYTALCGHIYCKMCSGYMKNKKCVYSDCEESDVMKFTESKAYAFQQRCYFYICGNCETKVHLGKFKEHVSGCYNFNKQL